MSQASEGRSARLLGIEDIASAELLRKVWRESVRRPLRSSTLGDLNLAADPLHYAAYDWGLGTLVQDLVEDLKLGRYTPTRGEIVRSAKVSGLSRPLCYLSPRDALVYRAITWLVRDDLTRSARTWTSVGRSEKGTAAKPQDVSVDSFDWFAFWLSRQGFVSKVLDKRETAFVVESDIANFYPSVRLEAVREHLHSETRLSKEVVRLCGQILDGVMPRSDYSEVSLLGLPQEAVGSSREIAHSLLNPVDQQFSKEGAEGRYTRYMDDILVGVESLSDGEKAIAKWQRSLEVLGLYPNAAKTRISTKADYLKDAMGSSNAALDRLHEDGPGDGWLAADGHGGQPSLQ